MLEKFLEESNRIEGITRRVTQEELTTTRSFLELPKLRVADVCNLVTVYTGYYGDPAILRDHEGLNVRVGNYIAPPGGPAIRSQLEQFLAGIGKTNWTPWRAHCFYETLHPFTDGNGRSGRAIWLWMKKGNAPLGFLHEFYYQTLQETR